MTLAVFNVEVMALRLLPETVQSQITMPTNFDAALHEDGRSASDLLSILHRLARFSFRKLMSFLMIQNPFTAKSSLFLAWPLVSKALCTLRQDPG